MSRRIGLLLAAAVCLSVHATPSSAAAQTAEERARVFAEIRLARYDEQAGDPQAAVRRLWPLFVPSTTETNLFLTLQRLLVLTEETLREEELLRRRLAELPDDRQALALSGDFRHRQGDRAGAMAAWRRITEAAPGEPDAWLTAAMHMHGASEGEEAVDLLREARLRLQDDTLFATQLAQYLVWLARREEAFGELVDWLASDARVLPEVESAIAGMGLNEEELRALADRTARAVPTAPQPGVLQRFQGRLLARIGAWREAVDPYRAADKAYRSGGGVLGELAREAVRARAWEGAVLAWEAVIEIAPSGVVRQTALIGLGRALEERGEDAAALPRYEEAMTLRIGSTEWEEAARLLAAAALRAGDEPRARRVLELLAAGGRTDTVRLEAAAGLADLRLRSGDLTRARADFAEIARLSGEGTGRGRTDRPEMIAIQARARIGEAVAVLLTGEAGTGTDMLIAAVRTVPGGRGGEEALRLAARIQVISSYAPDMLPTYAAARSSLSAGRPEEAVRDLQPLTITADGAALEEIRMTLAEAEAARGDSVAAVERYSEAAGGEGAIRPDEALLAGARLLAVTDPVHARGWLDRLLRNHPRSVYVPEARELLRLIDRRGR